MGIKETLEQAIAKLETEKNIEITAATERVTREKVLPNNQAVDVAMQKAFAELDSICSQKIISLQKSVEEDKQRMRDAAEKKKNDFAKSTITAETYAIVAKYDAAITGLEKQLDSVKE